MYGCDQLPRTCLYFKVIFAWRTTYLFHDVREYSFLLLAFMISTASIAMPTARSFRPSFHTVCAHIVFTRVYGSRSKQERERERKGECERDKMWPVLNKIMITQKKIYCSLFQYIHKRRNREKEMADFIDGSFAYLSHTIYHSFLCR